MPKFKLNPRQLRNLMVSVLLSFVVALPVLSQPLGLSYAWQYPVVDADENTDSLDGENLAAYTLDPLEEIDRADQLFNRSRNENDSTTETAPAVLDGEDENDNSEPVDEQAAGTADMPQETATEPTEPPYAAVNYILYISANELNLRAEASTDSTILAELKFGDKVNCVGENAEWMQVTFEGKTGYIKTEYTSRTMVFKSVSQTVYVDANKLNLRDGPSTSGSVITSFGYMQKLTRTGIGDGWSRVKTSAGKTGYVASDYLTTKAPSSSSGSTSGGTAPKNSSGNRIVDLAYSALGVRYVHSGSSMSGFDCSGLVSWVYRQIGITLPRSTSGYYSAGTAVSYGNAQPGDVLCMDTRRYDGKTSITHVGIYIGGGKMIHASSTKGKVVIQSVSQYLGWGVKLISVRRIPN